ncbi:hypothetical protein C4J83_0579 [Pseudomonas sp. LBUM920]|nr:hypothetical protein C4J83_0579 [Pseudomonas sp. LBUM920]
MPRCTRALVCAADGRCRAGRAHQIGALAGWACTGCAEVVPGSTTI